VSTRPSSRAEVRRLNLENDDLRRAIRGMHDRLADMVHCLFCEILEESTSRPTDFEDSMHKLSVVKRRGSALLREQRAQIECLEPGLGERLGGCSMSLGTDQGAKP